MWHLTNIPKRMFGFWGTEQFPYARFATLETFRKHHPDWEMVLYRKFVLDEYHNESRGKLDSKDNCWDLVKDLGIKIECIDLEDELNVTFPIPYITIFADIMRYVILNRHGGFYVDLDNLFWKSLEDCPFNNPGNVDIQTFMLPPPYHHFILSQPGAPVLDRILTKQLEILPETPDRILDTTACTMQVSMESVKTLPMETTEENFNSSGPINANAVALNWHGSGTYGKYFDITKDNVNESTHPLAGVIRYCLGTGIGNTEGYNFQWIQRGE